MSGFDMNSCLRRHASSVTLFLFMKEIVVIVLRGSKNNNKIFQKKFYCIIQIRHTCDMIEKEKD
jgi:hypothetical protein